MNWQEVTQNVLTFLIGSGIIGFAGKQLFKTYLDKNVDKYRYQLDKETEIFKQQLQLITQEHQIKYFKLHNDRAEVIKQLFNKLVVMKQAMLSYMALYKPIDNTDNDDKQKLASEAATDFFGYFRQNEIFFDESMCNLVKKIDDIYSDAWNQYTFHDTEIARQIAGENPDYRMKRAEDLKSSWGKINIMTQPINAELKGQFRNLLGVLDSIN